MNTTSTTPTSDPMATAPARRQTGWLLVHGCAVLTA